MKSSLFLISGAAIAFVAIVNAQSSRSYGPSRVWWESGQGGILPWEEDYDDPEGIVGILNERGAVHTEEHPFFQALGTNKRACITCHQPANAMSLSAAVVAKRWEETDGRDPLFAAIDGSNCPSLPQSERDSHSLLIERGLFRIALPWPPKDVKPDFRIEVVNDPTGCNNSGEYGLKSAKPAISVYRRPRLAANLKHLTSEGSGEAQGIRLMADGREPSLRSQAVTAVLGHEQATAPPTAEQLRQIVAFERQIFVAQSADMRGGLLTENDGPSILGPANVSQGRNGVLFEKVSYAGWQGPSRLPDGLQKDFRDSVVRGSEVFFKRSFPLEGRAPKGEKAATCATCHNQNGGTAWMNIGTTNKASDDLPLFKVTCDGGKTIFTQDPGRGLISGRCADVGAIVLQQFRGLAARAPYFSNGSAKTLRQVIDYYDERYKIGYTETEKADLANFLKVL